MRIEVKRAAVAMGSLMTLHNVGGGLGLAVQAFELALQLFAQVWAPPHHDSIGRIVTSFDMIRL